MNQIKAYLYLEDGTFLEGVFFGKIGEVKVELVFNTAMTGYQEILTDPSYKEQGVLMTYPLIGNYGINDFDYESSQAHLKAFLVREKCDQPSHYLANTTLDQYLKDQGVVGVSNIDTRMLTKKIRQQGTMKCHISADPRCFSVSEVKAYQIPNDLAAQVSVKEKKIWKNKGTRIGILDLGCKNGIIRKLSELNCELILYPYHTSAKEILNDQLSALLISNGPGDPKNNISVIQTVQKLIGKLPLWGICLGQQILALALNGDTYKMKFGHRGGNHPVRHLRDNKVFISSQNHGYAVDRKSLNEHVTLTYENVNDNSLEGFECSKFQIKAVQFHPEESPGPVDGSVIFANWLQSLNRKD